MLIAVMTPPENKQPRIEPEPAEKCGTPEKPASAMQDSRRMIKRSRYLVDPAASRYLLLARSRLRSPPSRSERCLPPRGQARPHGARHDPRRRRGLRTNMCFS